MSGLIDELLHFLPHYFLFLGFFEDVDQDGSVLCLVSDGVLVGRVGVGVGFWGKGGLGLFSDEV